MNPLTAVKEGLWEVAITREPLLALLPERMKHLDPDVNRRGIQRPGDSAYLDLFFAGGGGMRRISSSGHEIIQNYTFSTITHARDAEEVYATAKFELCVALQFAQEMLGPKFKDRFSLKIEPTASTDQDDPDGNRRPGWIGVMQVTASMRFESEALKKGDY